MVLDPRRLILRQHVPLGMPRTCSLLGAHASARWHWRVPESRSGGRASAGHLGADLARLQHPREGRPDHPRHLQRRTDAQEHVRAELQNLSRLAAEDRLESRSCRGKHARVKFSSIRLCSSPRDIGLLVLLFKGQNVICNCWNCVLLATAKFEHFKVFSENGYLFLRRRQSCCTRLFQLPKRRSKLSQVLSCSQP